MSRSRIEFTNNNGEVLAGLLETPPPSQATRHYALFAHCFTCGKDISVASRISRSLASQGIAVFRFDFTGLGNSDGDFANTNFSSNVEDLICASEMLAERFETPGLLIGHSLGGAAVLAAANRIPGSRALVTVGAPATADHVRHLFSAQTDAVREQGEAQVRIGLREFTIKQQLLDDLDQYTDAEHISKLKQALLIMHSPADAIVSINEAARIYQSATHPKSFISLDQADHLLSRKNDAEFVADTVAIWAKRYLEGAADTLQQEHSPSKNLDAGETLVTELDTQFLRGLFSTDHNLLADEPESYGGSNLGPTPYDLLLMSLGACTSMTIRMYANRKKLPLDDVTIRLKHDRIHAKDCEECEGRSGRIERITRYITLTGNLSEEQRQRILDIADRCPVHKTLESDPVIVSRLEGSYQE